MNPESTNQPDVSLRDLQSLIRDMYFEKDVARGVEGTFMWLMEEIGELSSALRNNEKRNNEKRNNEKRGQEGQGGHDRENLAEEFADVIAWLTTIANVVEIDLAAAIQKKYGEGCPGCKKLVCVCPDEEKP